MTTIPAEIFSKGLYSNWCYLPTQQCLFDCGEGAATYLSNRLPGIEHVFFSHEHGDHTLGLPSLMGCRNAAKGTSRNEATMEEHNKPLNIYYPEDNRKLMLSLFNFCEDRYGDWLRYKVNIIPIASGFELQLGKNTFLRAINLKHQKNQSTLGYVIYERRTRLKVEYRGLEQAEIRTMIQSGKVKSSDLSEPFRVNQFAYCLDAYEIPDIDQLIDCDDVIMDCTFVDATDRTDSTHFSLDEAKAVCSAAGIKNMYAAHFSSRYDFNKVVAKNPDVEFINPYVVNKI